MKNERRLRKLNSRQVSHALMLGGQGGGDRPTPVMTENDEQRRSQVRPGVL